ncbi:hypothetical protein AB1L42_11710 [Thalassoglobus sp. JC818]|uniref:hypothetical protein n=1 Tax=Thalassoglobus sp. JC818 TaxID=3232136 RepID=UPI0034587A59
MRTVCALLTICFLSGCEQASNSDSPADSPEAVEQQPVENKPQGFSKLEWKIVDKHKALEENPNLVEVSNETNAGDYLTAVTQSHFSATSRLNKATMEYNAKLSSFANSIESSEDPKPLTFEEFDEQVRLNPNNMKGLYPWQVYAYDETNGTVTILEDREEKKRLHEENGVPYSEDE